MTKPKKRPPDGHRLQRRNEGDTPRSPHVLIVTEGAVTEAAYFRLLATEMGLGRRGVKVLSSHASSPMQVVQQARRRIVQERRSFDYVYCVFDRDTHANYDEAVGLVQQMKKDSRPKMKVEAITSVPCFEYWCYLHVGVSAASHTGAGSPCARLTKELNKHALFKNYSKTKGWMSANLEKLATNRDEAVKRSKRRLANARRAGEKAHSEDPSTRVHIVVDDLKRLSETNGE